MASVWISGVEVRESSRPRSDATNGSQADRGRCARAACGSGIADLQLKPGHASAMGTLEPSSASERNRIFDVLASGNGELVLSMTGGETVNVPLVLMTKDDWHRPNCY